MAYTFSHPVINTSSTLFITWNLMKAGSSGSHPWGSDLWIHDPTCQNCNLMELPMFDHQAVPVRVHLVHYFIFFFPFSCMIRGVDQMFNYEEGESYTTNRVCDPQKLLKYTLQNPFMSSSSVTSLNHFPCEKYKNTREQIQ